MITAWQMALLAPADQFGCTCDSDEHWIPSILPDRIYTCMLCHRPVGLTATKIVKGRLLERLESE